MFKENLEKRKLILDDLVEVQIEISDLRQAKKEDITEQLNEFQTPDMLVEIELLRGGDREEFQDYLQDFSDLRDVLRTFRANKWPVLLADACTPVEFAQLIFDNDPTLLVTSQIIESTERSITETQANDIIEILRPVVRDEAAMIDIVDTRKLSNLLSIQEIEWDDKVRILRNRQPVENGSPGQRSSAMLPLIALAEKVPLIIDQPEDNLDNRLVGKVLVDILAKLKEKRQIIVCTHNPNIVVLGDAEQVIVLDADDNEHGHVEDIQASIDHPEIIGSVIELMEGGKDAFDTRSKRYANP